MKEAYKIWEMNCVVLLITYQALKGSNMWPSTEPSEGQTLVTGVKKVAAPGPNSHQQLQSCFSSLPLWINIPNPSLCWLLDKAYNNSPALYIFVKFLPPNPNSGRVQPQAYSEFVNEPPGSSGKDTHLGQWQCPWCWPTIRQAVCFCCLPFLTHSLELILLYLVLLFLQSSICGLWSHL